MENEQKKGALERAEDEVKADRLVNEMWAAYERGRDNGHTDYLERADKYNDYYVGDQWDDTTLATLKAGNRPAHTINLILSTVNAVLGEYLNSRQEIIIKPVTSAANPRTAELLTVQFDQIQQNNKSPWKEAQVFSDGIIEERGFLDIRIDHSDNILGEVRETVLDNRDVVLDPGAKEDDPNTWNEVSVTRWVTPDEIEELYGKDKADKLRQLPKVAEDGAAYSLDHIKYESSSYADDDGLYASGEGLRTGDDDYYKVARVRILDRQYWRLKRCFYFIDPQTGDERMAPHGWDEQRITAFAEQFGMIVHARTMRKVRWTVAAPAGVLLHDDWSPYDRFTVIPFFPYFRRGRPFGLVTNLISPQDLLNKTASQELHVVNTSANSGWMIEQGSIQNLTVGEMENIGAKTGLIIEYARGTSPPEKIQPNQIPSGLDRMTDKAGMWFREISGVSDAMLGQPGREISGIALDAKNQRGLVQLEVVFDNLDKMRARRADFILYLIQHFYTEPRLLKLVSRNIDGDEEEEFIKVNEYVEATQEILNDFTLGEYKVVVSTAPLRDTQDETEFAQLVQLREIGVMVPDFAILEATNVRGKNEMVQYAKQMAGMLEPSPEEVARQQAAEDAQLQLLMSQAAEAEAKAKERVANIQLLMAKAEAEGQKIPAEMQMLGSQLRVEMERIAAENQRNREDLQVRLQIAQMKQQELLTVNANDNMVRRLGEAQSERKSQRDMLTKLTDVRARDAQRVSNERLKIADMQSRERIANMKPKPATGSK